MSNSGGGPSYRKHTSRIRHLDAARAAQLVKLFARPVIVNDPSAGYDSRDPVTQASQGWLTLERAAAHGSSGPTVVGHYSTHLYLHEVIRMPLSVAWELSQHRGHLYLDKLEDITDSVAEELSKHVGGGLSLNNLRSLTVPAAQSLGRHAGELSLSRISSLGAEQALGLAQHTNELYLWGIKQLSSVAAAGLSQHRGDLMLDGLVSLSGRIAAHLTHHRGRLHLHAIAGLSDAVADAFGRREGFLCLKHLETLPASHARLIATHKGPLFLGSLELDDAAAKFLGQHEGSLSLTVQDEISTAALEGLLQHGGPLTLAGLETIDERRAHALANQRVLQGLAGLSALFLDDVEALPPRVAAVLATHRAGGLSLKRLWQLPEETAQELIRHPMLCLDGVSSMSDGVAKILGRYEGATLSLKGLKSISPLALSKLRDNPAIELPRRFYTASRNGTDRPSTAQAEPPRPDKLETIRIIQQIARHGEQMLKK